MTGTSRQVLLTGAAGFLGRSALAALVDAGHQVFATQHRTELPMGLGTVVPLDLAADDAAERLARVSHDTLVHLAAALPSGHGSLDGQAAAERNLRIDRAAFEAAGRREAHVVYASGCSVYGPGTDAPLDETAEPRPADDYVRGKLRGEQLAREICGEERVTVLRISAPYGPGQRARTVLRIFLERASADRPLTFFGSGEREQDFVFVDDVSAAVVAAVERRVPGTFHVASGAPVTMRELAQTIARVVPGCTSAVLAAGRPDPQEGGRARYLVDRARDALGWTPSTSLASGLARCLASPEEAS